MFDFATVDLCLDLSNHIQKARFWPVFIQIGTKNKATATTINASVIYGAIFYPNSSSHEIWSCLARKPLPKNTRKQHYFAHETITRTGITITKFFYKRLLNLALFSSRAQFAIKTETLLIARPPTCWNFDSFFFFLKQDKKKDKIEFVTKSVNALQILKKNTLLNPLKKSSPTLFTLVEELFNCCDYKTSFYYLSREVWLGKSRKLICTDQSRFYNFSHCRKWKIVSITSKCFRFFNNAPSANCRAYNTRLSYMLFLLVL